MEIKFVKKNCQSLFKEEIIVKMGWGHLKILLLIKAEFYMKAL
jgi:hypothetical protein